MFGDMCRITTVVSTQFVPQPKVCSASTDSSFVIAWNGKHPPTMADADQCVFIRGFRVKRMPFGIKVIGAVSGAADEISPNRDRRPRKRNNRLRNAASSLGDDSIGGSSSSLDTIADENPQRSPYKRDSLDDSLSTLSHIWGSSSSVDTIRPLIRPNNHENPQLHPYPSSTTLYSNGSVYNDSLMTSPSYEDSLIEVLDDIAEVWLPAYEFSL